MFRSLQLFKSISIRARLYSSAFVITLMLITLGIIATIAFNQLLHNTSNLSEKTSFFIRLTRTTEKVTDLDKILKQAVNQLDDSAHSIYTIRLEDLNSELKALSVETNEQKHKELINEAMSSFKEANVFIEQVFSLLMEKNYEEAKNNAIFADEILSDGISNLNKIKIRSSVSLNEQINKLREEAKVPLKIVIGSNVIISLLTIIVSMLVTKRISKPILSLRNQTEKVANGDYNVQIANRFDDEIGDLGNAFNEMTRKIKLTIKEKNSVLAQLAEAKLEIDHILNNLDEGIFTINLDCSVNAQHSRRARALFAVNDFQSAGLEGIFADHGDSLNIFKKWVDMIQEPRFLKNWQMYEKLNPFREIRRINGTEQILKVEYTPIVENDSLVKIMVLATDITEKIKSQQALEKSRHEQEALVERVIALVSSDKSFLNSFMSDMEKYLKESQAIASEEDLNRDLSQLYRDTHTIKGNAGTLGFGKLARHASRLEDSFLALKKDKDLNIYDQWRQRLQDIQAESIQIVDLSQKISSNDKDSFSISQKRYDDLLQKIASGEIAEIGMIYERLKAFNSKPFEFYCRKYQRIIELYREKYDKKIEDLQVTTPDLLVHHDIMKALDPSIIHMIRNAVDHGIESDKERKNVNKGPGIITILFTNDQSGCTLTVSDNGKGLDPDLIAQRAVKHGFITKEEVDRLSHDQKIDLIFEPDFSTKQETTEISGRGVGMDAVRANMEKLNGSVRIESEIGKGTSIILHLKNKVIIVKEMELAN